MRRYARLETGVFLAVWVLLLAAGRSRLFDDPGIFWHVAVGEQILSSGTFTDRDVFSFTRAGEPWAVYEWLGECVMALAHRAAGLDGLLLGSATLLAGLYAWLARRLVRAGFHPAWALLLVVLVLGASTSHFHARPHLATIALQAVTVALLAACDAGRIPLRRLFWLVPLFVLWTNAHGGVLGGIATVGLAAGGWCLLGVCGRESPVRGWRELAAAVLLVGACALTVVVNPFGRRVPETWLAIMRSPVVPLAVKEHGPPEWDRAYTWLVPLLGLVYLVLLASTGRRLPRATWLLPLAWCFLALDRVRHAPLFAVTTAVLLAEVLPYSRWRTRLGPAPGGAAPDRAGWRPALVPALVVAAALALHAARVPLPLVGSGWARLDPDHWPVGLLPELRACENAQRDGTPIFNEYALGGFLIYHTPGFRVFVDDRCEVYGDQWLADYIRAEWQDTDAMMADWEGRYRFDYALTWRGSHFDRWCRQSPGWALVGQTPGACFYRRQPAGVAAR
jgi:hypothetical protein